MEEGNVMHHRSSRERQEG